MARRDQAGFFWDDTPAPKPPKAEKPKRTPPEPVWLQPSYLPGLEEARAFPVRVMTPEEVWDAQQAGHEFIFDVEVYPNYFLVVFLDKETGAVFYLESTTGVSLNTPLLWWLLTNLKLVGFNSISYDMVICWLAASGSSIAFLKEVSDRIILRDERGGDILRECGVKPGKVDHIDLIEVAPLRASLKLYAGRLHMDKMQDLPFAPNTFLSPEQIAITRWYCVNDARNTLGLRECLDEHLELRREMSVEYGVDLRSKSDAQIAEAVIEHELTRLSGRRPRRPKIDVGTTYFYQVPHFLKYQSPLMNWALDVVRTSKFVVDASGSIAMPEAVKQLRIDINGSLYRMGIGGLHSSEQTAAHYTDDEYVLIDKDVTSYYPFIILNLGLAPKHLGKDFLDVYRSIVERRVSAKAAGLKVIADSLKIVVNGSFGKLGSMFSILYAPDLMIQVTLTGQLSLLMLIERLELAGIHVVSANTDGIVIKCPRKAIDYMNGVVAQWERDTGFNTEETRYMALYSRDVNNYIAVKQKEDKATKGWIETPDGTKTKGAYANPWASKKNLAERLHKNPANTICVEAVDKFLTSNTPIVKTIRECEDVTKFLSVRTVKGGAVKLWEGGPTEYVGKAVRWYYASGVGGELTYAKNGYSVPRSQGARPCMVLPESLPSDIDFEWYETEAYRILSDIGATHGQRA